MPEMGAGALVGVVVVSHSDLIARGVVELARQMAANVRIEAAGGTDDGRIGTSFDRVSAAIVAAETGAGAVVLCDLGSAILTAETALDFLDDDRRPRVRIADAPLVEGAVAASVAAESGGDLDTVVRAAQSAGGGADDSGEPVPVEEAASAPLGAGGDPRRSAA
ncbi:hypothetical protein GCM10025870_02190 [Agromyces marinus]|uniref:phosphoenolpyruvate--glycerone phosphotransferase n=2 Tax=Agromyces marinus TaxID=1389020 RepID=A0ABM8GXC3_9MICO|nr:hypothetical protein GCM10025870_02190 [Agromyces marinus]